MGKHQYEDDDGRVIADMSNVEKPSLASAWISRRGEMQLNDYRNAARENAYSGSDRGMSQELDGKERRAAIFGALGASLLIGGVFLVAFAIVILLMIFFWGAQ